MDPVDLLMNPLDFAIVSKSILYTLLCHTLYNGLYYETNTTDVDESIISINWEKLFVPPNKL